MTGRIRKGTVALLTVCSISLGTAATLGVGATASASRFGGPASIPLHGNWGGPTGRMSARASGAWS